MKKIVVAYRRRRSFRYHSKHAYPAGAYFCSYKSRQNTLGALPQDPDAPERPPGKPKGGFPDRGLNGAYKVSQMHLPPPNLPRFGGGERPPFLCKPPAPLTITMGQRLGSLQAADLEVFAYLPHSPPPPRRGQGWWFAVLRSSAAAIKMRRRLFLSPSACSTDLFLGGSLKINSYPAQQGDRVFRAQP